MCISQKVLICQLFFFLGGGGGDNDDTDDNDNDNNDDVNNNEGINYSERGMYNHQFASR